MIRSFGLSSAFIVALGSFIRLPVAWNPGSDCDKPAIRRAVASQMLSEFSLYGAPRSPAVPHASITVRRIGTSVAAATLWMASLAGEENRHPYLVVCSNDDMLRLGGFQDPDLRAASRVVRQAGERDITRMAYTLAAWADPNGGRELVFPGPVDSATAVPVKARWSDLRPSDWPDDGASRTSAGITFTVLSKVEAHFADSWLPICYHMEFDSSGILLSWSRRLGVYFTVPR